MVNFGLLAAEISPVVWAPQLISMGFASCQHYCTALQKWASVKLCGVEQMAPPVFDRAAMMLGNDPRSSILEYNATYQHYVAALQLLQLHPADGAKAAVISQHSTMY